MISHEATRQPNYTRCIAEVDMLSKLKALSKYSVLWSDRSTGTPGITSFSRGMELYSITQERLDKLVQACCQAVIEANRGSRRILNWTSIGCLESFKAAALHLVPRYVRVCEQVQYIRTYVRNLRTKSRDLRGRQCSTSK